MLPIEQVELKISQHVKFMLGLKRKKKKKNQTYSNECTHQFSFFINNYALATVRLMIYDNNRINSLFSLKII